MSAPQKLPPARHRLLQRDFWITAGPVAFVIVAAFALAFYFVKPAPPKTIVLATSQEEGGFRWYARKYAELLEKQGVKLEVRPSDGSGQNVALLNDPASGVDVAFVQGGTTTPEKSPRLVSLGALSYVPIWVFLHGAPLADLRALAGRRVVVGPPDSGTRALAVQLLALNGADKPPTELLAMPRKDAEEALRAGTIDALFLVAPAESPSIRKLAAVPGIRIHSFTRADAYVRKLPLLTRLVLPRGVFDLANDVPAEDVVLLAPSANLVARAKLHPALMYLLMRVATDVHGSAGLLDGAGEFPAPRESGLPLAEEARRFYRSGTPLLQRYLPFWAANLVDRLWVMLVPVIAVLLPLLRVLPSLYAWRVRSRIYRWYARLKEVELQMDEKPDQGALEAMLARLDEIDQAVHQIPTPLAYSENLYTFRQHLDLVRSRVRQRLAAMPPVHAVGAA